MRKDLPQERLELPENVQKSTSIAVFKHSLKTFLFEQIMRSTH